MLENATNLTTQSEGIAMGYIINWLKAFFSAYAGEILLAILIVVTMSGVGAKLANKRSDFYNRFQKIYDNLLKPGEVELSYTMEGLTYSQQENQEWEGFIDEVRKHIKRHPFKYKARGLYEKVEKAFGDYKNCVVSIDEKIVSLSTDKLEEEGFGSMIWDSEGELPSDDYVEMPCIPHCIETIIKRGLTLDVKKSGDGRYALDCHRIIARATSKDMIKKLKKLIQSVVDGEGEGIKELFTKRDNAKGDADELLKRYNNKLVNVIQDLRFCRW